MNIAICLSLNLIALCITEFYYWIFGILLVYSIPIQKPDPLYIDIDGPEILLHPSLDNVGPGGVEDVAVAVIDLWEKDGFIDPRGIFKRDEFHGITLPCPHGLARDQPAGHGDPPAHVLPQVLCLNMFHTPQDIPIEVQGMGRKDKSQGLGFVLEHEALRIMARVVGPAGYGCRPLIAIKETGTLLLLSLSEELEGLPYQARPGHALTYTVKAARLDKDPRVLEMDMRNRSVQKILKGCERAILFSLTNDGPFGLMGEIFQLHETYAYGSFFPRVFYLAEVDIRG